MSLICWELYNCSYCLKKSFKALPFNFLLLTSERDDGPNRAENLLGDGAGLSVGGQLLLGQRRLRASNHAERKRQNLEKWQKWNVMSCGFIIISKTEQKSLSESFRTFPFERFELNLIIKRNEPTLCSRLDVLNLIKVVDCFLKP